MASGEDLPASREEDPEQPDLFKQLLQRVSALEARAFEPKSDVVEFSQDRLLTIAASIYRSRQFRAQYFPSSILAEPAWDMLLDLFINKIRGRRVSTTSLCLAANVPQATGLRWVGILTREGLAHRFRAPDDRRLMLIELTPRGYQVMKRFITDSVSRFDRAAVTD